MPRVTAAMHNVKHLKQRLVLLDAWRLLLPSVLPSLGLSSVSDGVWMHSTLTEFRTRWGGALYFASFASEHQPVIHLLF